VEPSAAPPWYSPLAILTALTLRAVFRLAFRQTEGLIGSDIGLLGLALRVPDHSTLSRRAATLEVPRPTRLSGAGVDGGSEPMHLLVDSTGFCNGAAGVKSLVRCLATGFWLLSVVGPGAAHKMRSEGAGKPISNTWSALARVADVRCCGFTRSRVPVTGPR
jgi:hypothetical protein